MVIYKITNLINGKVYIGQTRRGFEQRMKEHQNAAARGDGFYIGSAIAKYGWDNFSAEVIAETSDESVLDELEKYYIQKYKSDIVGYNLAPGGDTNTMDSPKVKAHHDAIMRSPEVRAKISQTVSRKIRESGRVEEYTANMRAGFRKYVQSEKFKQDSANRKLSPEHFKALNDAKNKAVYCIDESGQVVAEFSRVKDAAQWWYDQGYVVKTVGDLMNRIKQSYDQDRYIRGLKWIYRV